MKRRPIATRYTVLVVGLLCAALLASGALETWISHRDRQAVLEALLREKALATSAAVSGFIDDVIRGVEWSTLGAPPIARDELAQRRIEFLKLLRLQPAIATVTLVDSLGRERLRVSRLTTDRLAGGIDLSADPGFVAARAGRAYFSDVYFVAGTEPYLTIALPSAARDSSVVLADVNLKFVGDVVSEIKVGATGYAYVVDTRGRLVSHPDLSLVLQMTNLFDTPQVRAALTHDGEPQGLHRDGRNRSGSPVLAAHATIALPAWTVFVEQPHAEAYQSLVASIGRTAVILVLALALAVAAGIAAARRMVAPIGELRRGAQRFGAGDFAHRIEVASGDELEELAAQFNAMALQLREVYADLERRVAERTRELDLANQAKSRFLAVASHDLRQPMHALVLFVDQLRTSGTRAERTALTQRIEEAVGSLSALLDQLLDLSKLEAGAVQSAAQDFELGPVLAAIEMQFAPLARAKGVEFRLRSKQAWLHGDPVLMQRILLNLVANAIRYTERGGVLLGVRRRGEQVRIAVWDTGCGIPDDRSQDVFREFVQLGDPAHRHGRGMGLGLAIVARLAGVLGTRVELRSRLGRGSMFAFELPLGDAGELRTSQPLAPLRTADLSGTFVCVVDDDEAARTGMSGLLERWGCLTVAAACGDEAIAQLARHDRPPELIMCDYWLAAGESGLDVISRVRAATQEDVPAIVVTADTTAAVLAAAQAAGVPLLHKPVSPARLRALSVHLLAHAAGSQRAAA